MCVATLSNPAGSCVTPTPTPGNAAKFDCDSATKTCVVGVTYNDLASCNAACGAVPTKPPAINQNIFCGTGSNPSSGQINTAIGCIPVDNLQLFISTLLPWSIGIAGGIAVLLIIYAGFLYSTSAGNPQRIEAAKELLTAAISGLILLIFAALLLRIIGQTVLRIPGF